MRRYISKVYFIVFVLLFYPCLFSTAQLKEEGYTNDELKKYGLTNKKLDKLKKNGIDILKALKEQKPADEMITAVMSDVVAIGQVQTILDTPAPKEAPFHSKVIIKIKEILMGEVPKYDYLVVVQESGPILGTNGLAQRVSTDVGFQIGEQVLLFLQIPNKNSYLQARFKKYFKRNVINENEFWVNKYSKFVIIDDKVNYLGKERKLTEIVRNIKNVSRLLSD